MEKQPAPKALLDLLRWPFSAAAVKLVVIVAGDHVSHMALLAQMFVDAVLTVPKEQLLKTILQQLRSRKTLMVRQSKFKEEKAWLTQRKSRSWRMKMRMRRLRRQ